MKTCVVATALVIAALVPSRSQAQSRVSVELGGVISAYDVVGSRTGATSAAIRTPDSTNSSSVVSGGPTETVSQGIAAFEIRPTVTLQGGFLMGVGFRVGQAGIDGNTSASLVGADVALGYQHMFGRFMPFIKGMFGLNSYDLTTVSRQTDLRLDAVVGSRLYLSNRLFVSASAFAGWGDRYGASLSVGGDIVHVFHRGVMP
jgi:hypothetical protein